MRAGLLALLAECSPAELTRREKEIGSRPSNTMTYKDETQSSLGPPHEASSGQFRVIARSFKEPFAECLVGEFNDHRAAIRAVLNARKSMTKVYVYDDTGDLQAIATSLV
jgi:hypothetical protein